MCIFSRLHKHYVKIHDFIGFRHDMQNIIGSKKTRILYFKSLFISNIKYDLWEKIVF